MRKYFLYSSTLRRALDERGMSVDELSQRSHVSADAINDALSDYDLKFSEACKVSDALDMGLELFAGAEPDSEPDCDARMSLLQSCYARLDDAGRERLLEYAALLCDSGDYDRDDSTKTPMLKDVRRLFS